GAH
ncbi:hypothetical protein D021_3731B, partial [Vibrio parahaemolyticus 10296]